MPIRAPAEHLRVLHITDTLAAGGAERQLVRVVASTAEAGVEHLVVQIGGSDRLASNLRAINTPVVDLGLSGHTQALRATPPLRRLVADFDPQIIHTWLFHSDLAGRLSAGRSRALLAAVQAPAYEPEAVRIAGWPPRTVALRRVLDRWSAAASQTTFVACSRFVSDSTVRLLRVPPDRVRVIYNAVEPNLRPSTVRLVVRRAERLPDDAFIVLAVGRLDPQKGYPVLLRAFRHVASEMPEAVLLIAGEGPQEATIRRQLAELGLAERVRLLGLRADVPDLMATADAFAFPSLFEGLGVALIEAMAAGLPAVVSDLEPTREIISSELTGLLVRPGKAHDVASALLRLGADPELRARLGAAAREEVKSRFTIDVTRAQWVHLYRKLANSRKAFIENRPTPDPGAPAPKLD